MVAVNVGVSVKPGDSVGVKVIVGLAVFSIVGKTAGVAVNVSSIVGVSSVFVMGVDTGDGGFLAPKAAFNGF